MLLPSAFALTVHQTEFAPEMVTLETAIAVPCEGLTWPQEYKPVIIEGTLRFESSSCDSSARPMVRLVSPELILGPGFAIILGSGLDAEDVVTTDCSDSNIRAASGGNAVSLSIEAARLRIDGTVIAGRGGDGGDAYAFDCQTDVVVQAGNGGLPSAILSTTPLPTGTVQEARGGHGGSAVASACPPGENGTAGAAPNGRDVDCEAPASGPGLHGVNATAIAGHGAPGAPAGGHGGNATAIAGPGGNGSNNTREGTNAADGGHGGHATAAGGNGGAGISRGHGGFARAVGGMGGDGGNVVDFGANDSATSGNGGDAGSAIASGGNGGVGGLTGGFGGNATAYGLQGGDGGSGLSRHAIGGDGGKSARVSATAGAGGQGFGFSGGRGGLAMASSERSGNGGDGTLQGGLRGSLQNVTAIGGDGGAGGLNGGPGGPASSNIGAGGRNGDIIAYRPSATSSQPSSRDPEQNGAKETPGVSLLATLVVIGVASLLLRRR